MKKGAGATRAVYGRGYECLSRKFLPAIPTATGEKKYFQSDLYGSALFATNEKGEMLRYAKRGVWGERNGAEEEGLRFTTYSHDPVIGKYFAQARFYDSRQGRMLAKDPVKNGLNGYAYCGNDPVNFVDPSGKIALTHLLKSVGAGLFDGVCDFGESAWNQYKNGGEIDWLDALGAGAKGFVKGTAEEFFLGSKTKRWMMAVADFGAGTLGSLAEQFISGDGIDFGDAFHDGIMNTVEGQAFGKKSVDGVWDALKRGSKAGAATSIVDNVYGALTAGKNGGGLSAGTGMLGLALNHGISQAMNRDPKTACGSSSPFRSGLNFNGGYGNQKGSYAGRSQTENGWSLENAIKDVVNDTIWGGLGSVAQYAGGTFFEAVGNSIFGRSKSVTDTIDNRLVNNLYFENGERIATTKQIRDYIKQMQSKGISVAVDKKGKVLTGNKAAGFDYATGTVYIKKKSGVIDLYHEGFHAEQYLNIGQENYVSLGTLAREEYVYSRIMDNSSMFNEVELQGATNYITRLRRRYK